MSNIAFPMICTFFLLSLCSPGLLRRTSHGYPHIGGRSGGGHTYPSPYPSYPTPSYGRSCVYPPSSVSCSYYGHSAHRCGHYYPTTNKPTCHEHTDPNRRFGGNDSSIRYRYYPPQHISYSYGGGPARTYPVYHGALPTYVYQYRDSSSKYGTLLTGLALLNLGMLTASTFSHHQNTQYKPQPGEVCKLGIRRENGDYEETRIKCDLISNFIWAEEERRRSQAANPAMTTTTSVVVTTTTFVNNTTPNVAPQADALYMNGTMVPNNATLTNAAQPNGDVNGNVTTPVVTTTVTNTTTEADALDAENNGPPVKVTDGMQCYVIRHTYTSNMRHTIPCGLLQTYASQLLITSEIDNVVNDLVIALMKSLKSVFAL